MLGLIFSIALLLINKLVHLMMFYVIKIQFHKQFDWRRIVKKQYHGMILPLLLI